LPSYSIRRDNIMLLKCVGRAKFLGIDRKTLRIKMRNFGIKIENQ
jgi:transcriptional regulator of acetoin/glycerol metabolism